MILLPSRFVVNGVGGPGQLDGQLSRIERLDRARPVHLGKAAAMSLV